MGLIAHNLLTVFKFKTGTRNGSCLNILAHVNVCHTSSAVRPSLYQPCKAG